MKGKSVGMPCQIDTCLLRPELLFVKRWVGDNRLVGSVCFPVFDVAQYRIDAAVKG